MSETKFGLLAYVDYLVILVENKDGFTEQTPELLEAAKRVIIGNKRGKNRVHDSS